MRIVSVVMLLSVLSGCAAVRVQDDFSVKPSSDEGMIVFSTRTTERCHSTVGGSFLRFYPVVDGEVKLTLANQEQITLMGALLTYDFASPPGFFYARAIKAGDYRITSFDKGVYGAFVRSDGFRIDFHIEPGRIYYLGEIGVDIDCSTTAISIRDERHRDGALFNQRMKHLKSSIFEYQILQVGKRGSSSPEVQGILPSSSSGNSSYIPQKQSGSMAAQAQVPKRQFGKHSYNVEKMAKNNGCFGGSGAYLTTESGPVEAYRIDCENGQMYLARCEYGVCKESK